MTDCKLGSGMLDELLTWPTGDLWLFGSDGEDDDDAGSDDDGDDDEDDEDEDEGDDPEDKSKKSGSGKPKWKRPSDEDIKAMQRRLGNFDEERNRDKGKITKLTDSVKEKDAEIKRLKTDGVKDEEVKQRNTELEGENSRLKSEATQLRIQIAFLGDTTHQWQNPGRAVKLLDTSNVEVDDKGRVSGLKTAIDDLAESDSYLLVQERDDKDDEDDKPQRRRTGDQPKPRNPRGKAAQTARDDKLRQRFSGLRH